MGGRRAASWVSSFGCSRSLPAGGLAGVSFVLLNPEALAAAERFAFPERGTGFQGVDDKFGRPEGLPPVSTGYPNKDNLFRVMQFADAMHHHAVQDIPALLGCFT